MALNTMISKAEKSLALGMLLNARMQHTKWVSEVLKSDVPHVEEDHTRCDFGNWLLISGEGLNQLQAFQDLEQPHRELHQAYMRLKGNPDLDDLRRQTRVLSNRLIDKIDLLEKALKQI